MRTKRVQRRRARIPAKPTGRTGYPDLFSRDNADLVQDEVELEGMCPCCIDRQAEIELGREERLYYGDAMEQAEDFYGWQREEFEDRYEALYQSLCPLSGAATLRSSKTNLPVSWQGCFCTDCCEASEHDGPDYEEWRRAFPALPWGVDKASATI